MTIFSVEISAIVTFVEAYSCTGFVFTTEAVESSFEVLWFFDCYRGNGLWKYFDVRTKILRFLFNFVTKILSEIFLFGYYESHLAILLM